MTFGEFVRGKGYTAKSLAEAAGVSMRNVENYTTGRRAIKNMTLELALKLSKALGIEPDDLLKLEG